MAIEKHTRLGEMQAKIAEVEKSARELAALGQGVPAVEKNARSILTAAALLSYGISDVAEAEN
jgi:hypothetical protein